MQGTVAHYIYKPENAFILKNISRPLILFLSYWAAWKKKKVVPNGQI